MKKTINFCLAILCLLFFAACGGNNEKEADVDIIHNPNSAEGFDESEKMPKIVFDRCP